MVADLDPVGGQRVASSMPDRISFLQTNVTKEGDWRVLMDETQKQFGRLDCLVNNAGTTYKNKVGKRLYRIT